MNNSAIPMKPQKALIATYYWPPAGGPGVQRWLKFVKYLPEFGIEPVVYVPENPSYPIRDESLKNQVSKDVKIIQSKIWEPYQIAEMLNPKAKDYKAGHFEKSSQQSFLTKLLVFIRGNFFIPDSRKFWVKPSVKFLNEYLKTHEINTIITTGPPHSLHLIGLKLKQQNPNLKWLADFRDPWTQISYHSALKLGNYAQKKHRQLEKEVLQSADTVIATSFTDGENYIKSGAKNVEVITNGYETSDFQNPTKEADKTFKIVYSGGLEIARNPIPVWQALKELIAENENFRNDLQLIFYGNLSEEVEKSIKEYDLTFYLIKKGYVTHSESINGILNADLLLLTNFPDEKSKGIIPGKLFEYMATENPVLAIGPENADVDKILWETAYGKHFSYNEKEKIKSYIAAIYQNKNLPPVDFKPTYEKYSRRKLTEKLAALISTLNA